jgi:Calx-beta domain
MKRNSSLACFVSGAQPLARRLTHLFSRRSGWLAALAALRLLVPAPLQAASTIQFSTTTYAITEGAPEVAIVVQRANGLDTVVSVDFATTTNGNATAGMDYLDVSMNLTFLANETNKTVAVPILNDGFLEGLETFRVILTNASGDAVLGVRTNATVRITDNDDGLQLELPSYFVNEDAGTIKVRVLRRDDGDMPVSVNYATSNSTAVAGEDYLAAAGTLTFAPGENLQPVTVTLLNDAVRETNKLFRILLSNPSGGGVLGANPSATITITNTDDVVEFQAASVTNREGAAFTRIAVIRGESALASTVDATTANGTALAGLDYLGTTNTLTFAAGQRLKFIDVPLLNDGLKESSETFRVALSNPDWRGGIGGNIYTNRDGHDSRQRSRGGI